MLYIIKNNITIMNFYSFVADNPYIITIKN